MKVLVRLMFAAVVGLGLATGPVWAAGGGDSADIPVDPTYAKAKEMLDSGNYAAAVPLLEQAVAANPKNANAFNYLGYSLRQLGNREAALESYQKALAIQPKHRGANEYLGELYLEMGQLDKAKERLDVLDSACFFGCEEYRELKAAIKAYEEKAGS